MKQLPAVPRSTLLGALWLGLTVAACAPAPDPSDDVAAVPAAMPMAASAPLMAVPPGRPNILFIISDDVGLDVSTSMYPGMVEQMVQHYGPVGLDHPAYQSIAGAPASMPVLAEFARQGLVFSNVYAHPFCSPTRASILTGLYGARTHVLTYADPLSQSHLPFVKLLKEEGGYSTGLFGKWHLAGLPGQNGAPDYPGLKPKEAGFDVFRGNLHAALASYWDYDYQVQDENTSASEWRTDPMPVKGLPGIAPTNYAEAVKVADAIDWLTAQESSNPDTPWFAWVAFNLSHATSIQQPSAMAVPNLDTLDAPSRAEMEACGGEFGTNNTGTCSGEALMRAMTNSMDTLIGKLLDTVDALDPNTIVIYIGDNGTPMYARPNLDFIDNLYITRDGRGKGSVYESGARVPLAIRGPGIAAGTRSDAIVHAADLFPTLLEVAGLMTPTQVPTSDGTGTVPLDAVSLKPILDDSSASVRDPDQGYVLTENVNLMTGGTRMVGARNANWKLACVEGIDQEHCQFFNLADDPLEEYPLAKPAACMDYTGGSWTPANAEWHYCRLSEVVATQSFF
jgi:arylsulfatase A-like enzyme